MICELPFGRAGRPDSVQWLPAAMTAHTCTPFVAKTAEAAQGSPQCLVTQFVPETPSVCRWPIY